jgi:hypothetical protein
MATSKKHFNILRQKPNFGNAAKIGFLHKLLLRVSKLWVGTVGETIILSERIF